MGASEARDPEGGCCKPPCAGSPADTGFRLLWGRTKEPGDRTARYNYVWFVRNLLSSSRAPVCIPPVVMGTHECLRIRASGWARSVLGSAALIRVVAPRWRPLCVFLKACDVARLFLRRPPSAPLLRCGVRSGLPPTFCVVFLLLGVKRSFLKFHFEYKPLIRSVFCKYVLPVRGLLSQSLDSVFIREDMFNVNEVQLIN